MRRHSVRLTHKIMAIGVVGLIGFSHSGLSIRSATGRRTRPVFGVRNNARAISELNKQLSIEMLEARRNEKNFQARRNESYAKAHAELVMTGRS